MQSKFFFKWIKLPKLRNKSKLSGTVIVDIGLKPVLFIQRYVIKWIFGPGEKSLEELNLEASLNVQKSIVELLRSVEALQVINYN